MSATADKAPPAPRPHRWRRRFVRLLLVVLAARLLLTIAMPWLVAFGAGFAGLQVEYRSGSLSLLGASLQLQDVVVRDAAHPELAPLLRCEQLLADLDASDLVRGDVHVVEVAVTGASVALSLDEHGQPVLPGGAAAAPTPAAPTPADTPPAAAPAGPPEPLRFALPFRIDSVRVHDLRVELRDAAAPAAAGPIESWLLDVTVADLGWPDRQGKLEARFHDPRRLDHLRVQATADVQPKRLAVQLEISGKGLRLQSPLFDQLREPFEHRARLADTELHATLEISSNDTPGQLEMRAEVHGNVDLDGERAAELGFDLGPCAHEDAGTRAPFALHLKVPGMVGELAANDGELRLGAGSLHVATTLAATDVRLDPVRLWLQRQGIVWPQALACGLRVEFDSRRDGDHDVLGFAVTDVSCGDGDDAVRLARAAVEGMRVTADRTSIDALRLEGPALRVRQLADGGLELAGIRIEPPTAPPDVTPTAADAPPPAPAATAPPAAFALDALHVEGLDVTWRDETFDPPAELRIADLSLQGRDLAVGDPAGAAPAKGALEFTARVPEVIEQLRSVLTVAPTATGADLALQLQGSGATLARLQPWLQRAGVQVAWRDAALRLDARANLQLDAAGTRGAVALTELRLTDDQATLLQVGPAGLESFAATADGLQLGVADLKGLDVRVERLADGGLLVAGLRVAGGAAANHRLWQIAGDARVAPDGADGRTFEATLRIDGAVEQARVAGTLRGAGSRHDLDATLAVRGISGAGLGNLMPPGVTCVLEAGEFSGTLKASLDSDSGALDADLANLVLREGGQSLIGIESLRLQMPEAGAERVRVQTAALLGVSADVRQTTAGLEVAGLRFAAAGAAAAADETQAAAPTEPEKPTESAKATPRPAGPAPALAIDAVTVQIAALRFHDETLPGAEPLEANLRLELTEPWQTAEDKALSGPMLFELQGAARPLLGKLQTHLQLSPFALQPLADLQLQLRDIDTTAIARVLPAAAERLTGTCSNATLDAHIVAQLDLRRRTADTFDLSQPFGIGVRVEGLRYGAPDATPFFEVPEAEIAVRSFDPASGQLLVQRVELVEPALRLTQSAEGLDFGGVRLLPAPPAPPAAAGAETAQAPLPAAAKPAAETLIDRLRLQGLRVDYLDTRTTPATHLPIASLDVDVREFSTRALHEARPFSFSMDLTGGDVDINQPGSDPAAAKDGHDPDLRTLVGDVAVRGRLALVPVLDGEVHARVDSFELTTIRGLASGANVDIAEGRLDLTVDAEFHGTRGGVIHAVPVFSSLSISEPAGGPISTYLRLPAPLDTVLFLLRDDDGEHRLPVRVVLDNHKLDPATIRDAAVEAIALLLGKAVGSTPMRALRSVTDLFGITGKRDPRELDTAVDFPAGQTTAPPTDFAAIAEMLAAEPHRRVVLRHEPGVGDKERVAALANPRSAMVLTSITDLRQQRDQLLARRQPLATGLAARLTAGRAGETFAMQQELADLDTRLGALEATLDEALQMLDEGTSGATNRRTREALRDLGEVRMRVVRQRLRDLLGDDFEGRVELRAPRTLPKADLEAGGRVLVTVR
ncbi:MAG: DUF748 domain-containing protein [Planctomycetes bacterium]|nr:DUF748 domain-containing protein [Planctomycetota bacterium]